ncbi:SDR family NAD(P)-dependent oxidoreductase [Agrobacterium vitis]|uniref:SDR family oxidoreductase n=1 Tax=Agrobacterium vitis TaxID=373 RepID=UPI0012E8093E|nr:SDR family oxidoreductase [Agrobacterium vitis]MVA82222.1 SDR family NAD(P)-dependent oxidoreductase [Agrobacterium vitis]
MEIQDAVILVTGASSGIGEATARAVAQSGARVVLLARRKDRIDALARELGDEALAVVCDVTCTEDVQQAVQAAIGKFGRIDALVNNAGQGLYGGIEDIGIDDFRKLLNLNSVAPLITMQAVIPFMRKQHAGSIVNVSSGATLAIYPGSAAYTSSKSALNMLSSVARLELADAGIVVSIMHPFITATEFYGSVKSGLDSAKAQEAGTASFAQRPELVAKTILDLIRNGDAQTDLVPKEYGGSFEG